MLIRVPTPTHLMQHTVKVNTVTWGVESTSGAPEATTIAGDTDISAFVQPLSETETALYGRDTNSRLYQVFMYPTDVNGSNYTIPRTGSLIWGTTELWVVEVKDPAGIGCLNKVICERKV